VNTDIGGTTAGYDVRLRTAQKLLCFFDKALSDAKYPSKPPLLPNAGRTFFSASRLDKRSPLSVWLFPRVPPRALQNCGVKIQPIRRVDYR
jgi:hypothetical protein